MYRVQWTVEYLFGASLVAQVNTNPSDGGQLLSNVDRAITAFPKLEVEEVAADSGYHHGLDIATLQLQGITTVVGLSGQRVSPGITEPYQAKHFSYEKHLDAYRCPAGNLLNKKETVNKSPGRLKYFGAPCQTCPFSKDCCQNGKVGRRGRSISHTTYQQNIDANKQQYLSEPGILSRKRRSVLAEGITARIKELFGLRKLRTWGKTRVQGEISLVEFAFNTMLFAKIWQPLLSKDSPLRSYTPA